MLKSPVFQPMSTLLTTQVANNAIKRRMIRDGVNGNLDAVFEMVRVIRDSVTYDKGLETFAKSLLISGDVSSFDNAEQQLKLIYDYVKINIHYVLDVAGRVESIKSARQTLSDGYGDCDDLTNLLASLCGCVGFENIKIALAKYSKTQNVYSHVYCIVYAGGKRYVLDASIPNGQFNQEIKPTEILEIGVFDSVQGLDGVSGIVNNIRYNAKRAAKKAVDVVPNVVEFLPLSFLAGNALATGAELLNQSGAENLSLNAVASKINADLDAIIFDLMRSRIAFNLAKTKAMQIAAQIAAVEMANIDYDTFKVIRDSIKTKLEFIKQFPNFAKQHGIEIVHLDSRLILLAGAGALGFVGYGVYKKYFSK